MTPILPARMINEYVYCPRLAYLEWVQGEWAASADTVEGDHVHRRVDKPGGHLEVLDIDVGDSEAEPVKIHARSVDLTSEILGITAKLDLVEGEGNQVQPVDYKRGKRPHIAPGAYNPERVQICLQGLLLREHGYSCDSGVLYYAASKERVTVEIDELLIEITHEAIDGLRAIATEGRMPLPLEDSPKCPRCSLVGICLPDEVNFLRNSHDKIRPLAVANPRALPLVVQSHYATISKIGDELVLEAEGKSRRVRTRDVSQLSIMGNASITTPCLRALMEKQIPVSWHSYSGWFSGHTIGTGHKNVELRTAQYRASFDPDTCLSIAKSLVANKVLNARTLLRRNWRDGKMPDALALDMKRDARQASQAHSLEQLLGIEGAAAARYFKHFSQMIKQQSDAPLAFDFNGRNRRPPKDPVNALLSLGYAVLSKHWTVTLSAVGFDPYRGFYHQPRYGRPALALDMMEPFRPLLVDSAVIGAINNGEVKASNFVHRAGAVTLNDSGRKAFLAALERRLSQEVSHPVFGYKASYRRILEIQARLMSRYLMGELEKPSAFVTR